MEKALSSCRVSSREQEETGYSLDAQEKLLSDYAGSKDFKVEKVYKITESASGKQVRKNIQRNAPVCGQARHQHHPVRED